MPGGFSINNEVYNGTAIAALTASSVGTTVAASASANTLGSWVQLTASSPVDCVGMLIAVNGFEAVARSGAIDIGVGGSGSEVVIASKLLMNSVNADYVTATVIYLPIAIPAGTRISARCQCSDTSDSVSISAILFQGSFSNGEGYAGVDAIGFLSGTTLGTAIDPGGTINTKGAYAQMISSTARDYAGFFFIFDNQSHDSTSGSVFASFLVDIAMGSSGSEVPFVPNLNMYRYSTTVFSIIYQPASPIIWNPVPAGTRLAARAQCSVNTATTRMLGITAYGIYR